MIRLLCSCARSSKPTSTLLEHENQELKDIRCIKTHAGESCVTADRSIEMTDGNCELWADPSDYVLLTVIGKSHYNAATVSVATNKRAKKNVAVKRINLEQNLVQFDLLQNEVLMHRQLSHPNLLPSLASFVRDREIWLILPLMSFGSCKDLLHTHFTSGLPEEAIAFIMRDVLLALEYLHSRNVVHRSVRASHILVSGQGVVALTGLSHACSMVKHGQLMSTLHQFPEHYVQSLLWASPELLEQNLTGYGTKSDIYSLGITACELANGIAPFADIPVTQMLKEKLAGTTPQLLDSITIPELAEHGTDLLNNTTDPDTKLQVPGTRTFSLAFHHYVENSLQADVNTRPSASVLLQHAFLKSVKHKNTPACLPQLLLPVKPLLKFTDLPKDDGAIDDIANDLDTVNITAEWSF